MLLKILLAILSAVSFITCGQVINNPANTNLPTLPLAMASIALPHQFTEGELDAIRTRLRAFSLELQIFFASAPFMTQSQLQQNVADAIWPLVQCFMSNGQ